MDHSIRAYAGSDPYIFVCYSRRDSAWVGEQMVWLNQSGINVWYDEGIRLGKEWTGEIAEAIRGASHVVYFVSEASAESKHCRNEVHFASRYDKPVLAIHMEEVELPPGLELELSLTQAMHAFGEMENHYQTALLEQLKGVKAPQGAEHQQPEPAPKNDNTIAVLPLKNLSKNEEDEYFSDGITEEILDRIGRESQLKVIAKSSSFQFKDKAVDVREIGRSVGAQYVLDGTVRRSGQFVRITVGLNDTRSGVQIWRSKINSDNENIFLIQDEAADIVLAGVKECLNLHTQALPEPKQQPTEVKSEAYDAVLRGIHDDFQNKPEAAVGHFERAIKLDPYFADAYARLGSSYLDLFSAYGGQLNTRIEYLPKAIDMAEKGWQLDPNSELTNRTMCRVHLFRFEWETAQRFCLRAMSINPSNAENYSLYAQLLRSTGRCQEALPYAEWALSLDPLGDRQLIQLILIDSGNFAAARDICLEEIGKLPAGPNGHYMQLTSSYGGEGDFKQVIRWQSHEYFPLPPIAFSNQASQELNRALQEGGRRGYFEAYLEWVLAMKSQGETFVLDTFLTWAYAELGYLDEAFLALKQVAKGSFIPEQYFYNGLRNDPRWEGFLAEHGMGSAFSEKLKSSADAYKLQIGFKEPWL